MLILVPHSLPYIIGSTKSLVITYTVRNDGETAYLPELNITTPAHIKFTKIPSACRLAVGLAATTAANRLLCDLSGGSGSKPLRTGESTSMLVHLDTQLLRPDGGELRVHALVSSSSDELSADDNEDLLAVRLGEFSTVEVIGHTSSEHVSLEEHNGGALGALNATHSLEVRNAGPSGMEGAVVVVRVPRTYVDPATLQRWDIVDWEQTDILVSGGDNCTLAQDILCFSFGCEVCSFGVFVICYVNVIICIL